MPAGSEPPVVAPYWERSKKPLAILVFLLPFVLWYELSLVLLSGDSGRLDIVAYQNIKSLFEHLGMKELFEDLGLQGGAMAIPGILLVVCLLAWHVLERDSWRLQGPTIPLMWLESILVSVPVIVLGLAISFISLMWGMDTVADPVVEGELVGANHSKWSLLSMAIGAGLYEELIFRWVLIAVTHTILADVFKMPGRTAILISVLLSSVLFMWAHEPTSLAPAGFYVLAGIWFSVLYLVRGFGIAAGGHIAYDMVWVLWVVLQRPNG